MAFTLAGCSDPDTPAASESPKAVAPGATPPTPKAGDERGQLTKANPKFSWVVGGKTYQFCCPPCVDEFVALAKEKPDEVKEPEFYSQT